jgi:hypothetical protein
LETVDAVNAMAVTGNWAMGVGSGGRSGTRKQSLLQLRSLDWVRDWKLSIFQSFFTLNSGYLVGDSRGTAWVVDIVSKK